MVFVKFSLVILTCIVAACLALPVQKEKHAIIVNDKWATLTDISQKLRDVITQDCQAVRNVVENDNNDEVGPFIIEKLNEACDDALAENDKLDGGVVNEDLTVEDAEAIFEEFNQIDNRLRGEIGDDIEKLSQTAQTACQAVMLGYRTSVAALGAATKAVLGTRGLVTPLSDDKFLRLFNISSDMKSLLNSGADDIVYIAETENMEVGTDIRNKVLVASEKWALLLDNIDEHIANQSLSMEDYGPILEQLKDAFYEFAEDVVKNDLFKLSPTAAYYIYMTIQGTGFSFEMSRFSFVSIVNSGKLA